MRITILLLTLAVASTAAASDAQVPDSSVRVVVTLDRSDWTYRTGDSAHFTVTVQHQGHTVPAARVAIEMGAEKMPPHVLDTITLADGGAHRRAATMSVPGFYRLTARAVVDGAEVVGMATAAFSPEAIRPATPLPADFMEFWNAAIADARRIPLEPSLTHLPGRSTADVDVYHVNFRNHKATSRIYGMLSVPKAPGRYPAILTVPGAGARPYFPSIPTARRGVIHLAIGIHGIPVDRDSLLYNELRATALEHYRYSGMEDRDSYYFKRVFVGVVRAGDFIFQLPQFDGGRYAVQGGSQGGGLAIVAAALDPRIRALSVSYPALADHWAFIEGRAVGWPAALQRWREVVALPEKMATLRYYDVANFARFVKVPGIYAWGFNDTVVPPSSAYAAFNMITAPKQLLVEPAAGHFRADWQSRQMTEWLMRQLGRQ